MLSKDLIDIAYEYVKETLSKEPNEITLDFKTICNGVIEKSGLSKTEFESIIGSFYVDLMQDGRVVYLGNDKWNLKDRIYLEVYKKNLNSLYDYDSTQAVLEEDAIVQSSNDEDIYEIEDDSTNDDIDDIDDEIIDADESIDDENLDDELNSDI